MLNTTSRNYTGPLQAIIFDWAGTVLDFGSFAPTQVLVEAFKQLGITLTLTEARGPMGLAKWDHIKAVGQMESVAARWQQKFGRAMNDADVDQIYALFMPLQIAHVGEFSQPISGAIETINALRERGLKIGSCTGYPRAVMNTLQPIAAQYGFTPDYIVAADDLKAGARPGPWMALANVIELGISHVAACIKVDDTIPGITEGLSAGMWTVGLAISGNEVGLTEPEWHALNADEQARLRDIASAKLAAAGAHFVIDSIADLPAVIVEIEQALARGERP
ncbi:MULTISPECIES: phosphonoacetaldehyde hydrolase [Deefgea]|uniref:Phosphonoacetaldehyde hydrolase n=1 Tax=Deefgea chitinilytica TaxID=570276 RepID=A0ABS2CAY2_9NEIS|nr:MULTISPECIES: phosphonoacetaldehyde hydrolase [Deefgea]MBM5571306.1 phosphonoacetaldehyde hydrolase [Deefgea chitinilytica]MBM9888538.1 phosphonoacetaldehyde hydrolase [Deefgea sp. CFH1-16]